MPKKPKIEVFDRHGNVVHDDVIPDGGHVHVPMMLRDADQVRRRRKVQQRDPMGREAGTFEEEEDNKEDAMSIDTDAATIVVDGFGRSDLAAMSRPGSRYLHSGRKTLDHVRQVTRRAMVDEAYRDSVAGASNAWRRNVSDREIAVTSNTGDAVRDAYLDQLADLTSAWQRR
jgi:hypothetical protein